MYVCTVFAFQWLTLVIVLHSTYSVHAAMSRVVLCSVHLADHLRRYRSVWKVVFQNHSTYAHTVYSVCVLTDEGGCPSRQTVGPLENLQPLYEQQSHAHTVCSHH